jgi:predicted dehydrogenase
LHGYFENYAADEGLGPEHWFWDPAKSGGIFIEHGVHFFDLFAGWLGPGKVVSAQASTRPGSGFEDQVQCSVRYDQGPVVNFYHGFHQAGRMDRQELRLIFERGDVLLEEWIPTRFRIHAIADEAQTRELCEIFPGARLDVSAIYGGQDRHCRGRQHEYDVYQMLELTGGSDRHKMHIYGDLLRAVLGDQMAWIENHAHPRRISEQNGRDSLALAVESTRLAHAPGK